MDNIVEKAKTDLAALRAQAAVIEGEIQELEVFLRTYNRLASNRAATAYKGAISPIEATSKKAQIEEGAVKALTSKSPLNTFELFGILDAWGVPVKSSNELSVYMSGAKDKFTNDRRLGWSLKNAEPQDAPTA